jgi:hypothetical protein
MIVLLAAILVVVIVLKLFVLALIALLLLVLPLGILYVMIKYWKVTLGIILVLWLLGMLYSALLNLPNEEFIKFL